MRRIEINNIEYVVRAKIERHPTLEAQFVVILMLSPTYEYALAGAEIIYRKETTTNSHLYWRCKDVSDRGYINEQILKHYKYI